MPTNGFSIKPRKVKLLAGEQKATENISQLGLELWLWNLPNVRHILPKGHTEKECVCSIELVRTLCLSCLVLEEPAKKWGGQ